MNKLRLIKIYEIRKQVHPIEQYIIDLLDGIDIILTENIIDYMKDDIYYFSYYRNTNNHWLSYALYEEYETNFGCSKEETKEIMKYLLEKHLKNEINNVK